MTLMDTPMWGLWDKATELGGRNAIMWASTLIYMCVYVFVKAWLETWFLQVESRDNVKLEADQKGGMILY